MTPQELTLLVTAVANSLYGCMSALELAVLASVFNQLGDTLETLAAQKALKHRAGRTSDDVRPAGEVKSPFQIQTSCRIAPPQWPRCTRGPRTPPR